MAFSAIYNHLLLLFCDLFCETFIRLHKGGFWGYRAKLLKSSKADQMPFMYLAYIESNNCYIGLKSSFKEPPFLPHGLHGIHISDRAIIGKGCTIMQNVTIGSNSFADSKKTGSPTIGNNVFIGANAIIVGKITIGDNVRIGAGTCVYRDIPKNHTVVGGGGVRIIPHDKELDNSFVPISKVL